MMQRNESEVSLGSLIPQHRGITVMNNSDLLIEQNKCLQLFIRTLVSAYFLQQFLRYLLINITIHSVSLKQNVRKKMRVQDS